MKKLDFSQNIEHLKCNSDVKTVIEKIFTILLVLCPILQHYTCASQDLSTVITVVLAPYFLWRLFSAEMWRFDLIWPLALLSIYEVLNHGVGVSELARECLLVLYFLIVAGGMLDLKYYLKAAMNVALAASGLIIIQYICYYIFKFHLQLVPTGLLKESAEQWVKLAQTGIISVTGKTMAFYRPSAFFLEPSHMTIYCFPIFVLLLMSEKMTKKRTAYAALVSLGIVLSTSGMGIAIVFGMWGIFVLKLLLGEGDWKEKVQRLCSPKSLKIIGALCAVVLLMYLLVSPLRMAVNRIFTSSDSGNNAIMGRMGTGIKVIKQLKGIEIIFGKQDWGSVSSWNMSGFFYSFYTQGIIGVILFYLFYVKSLFCTKKAHFWIGVILLGLSLVTLHTYAAFYMMYYVFILLSGYENKQNEKLMVTNPFYEKMNLLKATIKNRNKK